MADPKAAPKAEPPKTPPPPQNEPDPEPAQAEDPEQAEQPGPPPGPWAMTYPYPAYYLLPGNVAAYVQPGEVVDWGAEGPPDQHWEAVEPTSDASKQEG